MQERVDDLKVQLSQQQQAGNDATHALASREEELQQIKASSTTEVQAWQTKSDELKEVGYLVAGKEQGWTLTWTWHTVEVLNKPPQHGRITAG